MAFFFFQNKNLHHWSEKIESPAERKPCRTGQSMPCKINLAKCTWFCCVSSYLLALHVEAYCVEDLSWPF